MNTSAMELRLSWWMRQMTFISGQEHFGHFNIQDHLVEKQTDNLAAYEYSLKVKFLRNKWNAILKIAPGNKKGGSTESLPCGGASIPVFLIHHCR